MASPGNHDPIVRAEPRRRAVEGETIVIQEGAELGTEVLVTSHTP